MFAVNRLYKRRSNFNSPDIHVGASRIVQLGFPAQSIRMCNLHSNLTTHEAMRQLFDVSVENANLGNMPALPAIYPKGEAPIVAIGKSGDRALVRSSWGFLTPNKSKKTGNWIKPQAWNNTRDDKIRTSGLWRKSFEERRCLIPATGYAEATGRNPATYHWFRTSGAEAFAFAGIWQYRKGLVGDTEVDGVFHSMVTTSPNEIASKYHTRMPVILDPEQYEAWLRAEADEAFALLQPYPGKLSLIGEGIGMKEEPV